jgi:carboxyl-terminal processing protease
MKLRSFFGGFGLILTLAVSSLGLTTGLHRAPVPDTEEARIAAVTAQLLQQSSYTAHQEAEAVSGKFLDHYLDMLDGNRLYFLQSDIEEFAPYRTNLEAMAVKNGDTHPAHQIFNRFLQRQFLIIGDPLFDRRRRSISTVRTTTAGTGTTLRVRAT